ncbi:GDSL esterase/lipase [Acorus calamus]|uniref:GDSL esterase/lipase n=1 Tax=Acorus calamus TaxID=4465 RepID=A0AAV9EWU6_ACOCL|nr:GDSL esterase/lipase [Acorus calamus]
MDTTTIVVFILSSMAVIFAVFARGDHESLGASYIFGDSLVDAGNNNYLSTLSKANIRPNGIDFTASGGQPTGRYTNGRTIGDIVGEELGQPNYAQPFLAPNTTGRVILNGVNYASGGGGIMNGTGRIFVNRLSMDIQIDYFNITRKQIDDLLGKAKAREHIMKASIFSITIGANDFLNNYLLPVISTGVRISESPEGFIDDMINNLRSQLTKTINKLTQNECVGLANELAQRYNGRLRDLLTELNENLHGATFLLGNVYDLVLELITNYAKHDSERGLLWQWRAVPGDHTVRANVDHLRRSTKHVFWDPYHPSEAANLVIAKYLIDGDTKYISPMNIRQLRDL